MGIPLYQDTAGNWWPAALRGDTSAPRDFYSAVDPTWSSDVVVASGDRWMICNTPPTAPIGGGTFVVGVNQPTAANTGLQVPLSSLTTVNGDVIITTAGTVYENKLVRGIIDIRAANVTVQNCLVVGRRFSSYPGWDAMIHATSAATGAVIQYNECTMYDPLLNQDNWVNPANGYSAYFMVGVKATGGSGTVHRNNVHDCDHLTELGGGTWTVTGNWIHDPSFRTDDADHSSDATHPNWSHNDGVHVSGGTNHVVRGNSFDMKFSTLTGMNSVPNPDPTAEPVWPNCHGMLLRSSANAVTGVVIDQNWFKHGAVGPHFTNSTFTGGTATVTNNRFTPDQSREFSQYRQMVVDPTTSWTVTATGNTYSLDPDTPALIQGQALNAPVTSGTTKSWTYATTFTGTWPESTATFATRRLGNSFWHTPLASSAPIASTSSTLVANLALQASLSPTSSPVVGVYGPPYNTAMSTTNYSICVYDMPLSTLRVPVWARDTTKTNLQTMLDAGVPMPDPTLISDGSIAPSGTDGSIIIICGNEVWELFQVGPAVSGTDPSGYAWKCKQGGYMADKRTHPGIWAGSSFFGGGSGGRVLGWDWGVSAAGLSYLNALLLAEDYYAAAIDHPISIALPITGGTGSSAQKYLPATRNDKFNFTSSTNTTADPYRVPEGTWFRLPTSFDIPTWVAAHAVSSPGPTGSTAAVLTKVMTCLRDYGMIVMDSAGIVGFGGDHDKVYGTPYHPYSTTQRPVWGNFGQQLPWTSFVQIEPPTVDISVPGGA